MTIDEILNKELSGVVVWDNDKQDIIPLNSERKNNFKQQILLWHNEEVNKKLDELEKIEKEQIIYKLEGEFIETINRINKVTAEQWKSFEQKIQEMGNGGKNK